MYPFGRHGIITAKQLLYFKMAGAICSLCSLPHGQLYHFTRCVHGIITAKRLLYFKMAGAICSLCSLPHGQLYHFTRCVHGIITAKRLLYFKWRSPRPRWRCQLLQPAKPPIIPFTRCVHGIIKKQELCFLFRKHSSCFFCA